MWPNVLRNSLLFLLMLPVAAALVIETEPFTLCSIGGTPPCESWYTYTENTVGNCADGCLYAVESGGVGDGARLYRITDADSNDSPVARFAPTDTARICDSTNETVSWDFRVVSSSTAFPGFDGATIGGFQDGANWFVHFAARNGTRIYHRFAGGSGVDTGIDIQIGQWYNATLSEMRCINGMAAQARLNITELAVSELFTASGTVSTPFGGPNFTFGTTLLYNPTSQSETEFDNLECCYPQPAPPPPPPEPLDPGEIPFGGNKTEFAEAAGVTESQAEIMVGLIPIAGLAILGFGYAGSPGAVSGAIMGMVVSIVFQWWPLWALVFVAAAAAAFFLSFFKRGR